MIAANYLMNRGVQVLFMPASDLIGDLREAQLAKSQGGSLEAKIKLLVEIPVLIFDDVGKEKPTEWVQNQYFRIIDGRYRRQNITCLTSNYDLSQMARRFPEFGDAISSRLYEMTAGF